MKIISLNKRRANHSVQFPVLGHVKFDQDGIAEISEEAADEYFSAHGEDHALEVYDETQKKAEDTPTGKKGQKGGKVAKKQDEPKLPETPQDPEPILTQEELAAFTLEELKDVANAFSERKGIPVTEWENLDKEALIEFLLSV